MAISIHALLAESDTVQIVIVVVYALFLSTLSLRRATIKPIFSKINARNFYPRSPCGERHLRVLDGSKSSIISIHALLAESDNCTSIGRPKRLYFYPRSPCGERHTRGCKKMKLNNFYPRSPCGERPCGQLPTPEPPNFYPRSPCGERRRPGQTAKANKDFYPRSPCGERLSKRLI